MATISVRNRNEGKTYKDGRKKQPNWEYRFSVAKVNGKRQSISKSGFATKTIAQAEGVKALSEYNRSGQVFESTELSVADYFDYWIKNYCLVNVADSTLQAYRSISKKYIVSRLGKYYLKDITTPILQELITDIYVNRGFTQSFMKNILKVIKNAFKYATNTAHFISVNPALEVTLPRITQQNGNKGTLENEIIVLSKDNVKRILTRFKGSEYQYYAILTAYYTGLRISEVYGLTWDCIDFENKTITVNKIVKPIGKTKNGKKQYDTADKSTMCWCLGDCKTKSSYRTISVSDTLLNELEIYKAWQEQNEKEYGDYYTKHYGVDDITETHRKVTRILSLQSMVNVGYNRIYPVFIKENGTYRGTSSQRYPSKVINYELGIRFNFHALRHTHATMLIENGIDLKVVSARLGHSSTRITYDIYVHVTDKMELSAVQFFENEGAL